MRINPFDLPKVVDTEDANDALKANLVTFAKPETATTTHPSLICALVELLLERGASRVIVGDSPGGLYNAAFLNKVYSVCGLSAVEECGVIKSSGRISNDNA